MKRNAPGNKDQTDEANEKTGLKARTLDIGQAAQEQTDDTQGAAE